MVSGAGKMAVGLCTKSRDQDGSSAMRQRVRDMSGKPTAGNPARTWSGWPDPAAPERRLCEAKG